MDKEGPLVVKLTSTSEFGAVSLIMVMLPNGDVTEGIGSVFAPPPLECSASLKFADDPGVAPTPK